ncbi:isopeptide-forming domain-containing fimbrial protein [Microbulbifer celer]|uniref:Isopeptide-forming domain-containing fimbrial protein n=1 Tax=Microbulbifer celer TaxID=435905 RepID=A0ABW3U8B4_9GAMM|nr:isopeptide-forming domain-containing fimbrial protein [Microbulbifer celer]UFN57633.1 DUF11 domain-containing protein [Microbulbifer celer]
MAHLLLLEPFVMPTPVVGPPKKRCLNCGRTFIWRLLLLLAVVFSAAAGPASAQQMENTANISLSPDSNLVDSNPDNNTSTETLNVLPPPEISYNKVADVSEVAVGDTVTYTVTVTVADAPLSADLQITDTLGAGLQFSAVTDAGSFTCNNSNPLVCALPTGTPEGTYSLTYTALVTEDADTEVSNSVTASGGGDDTPVCDAECALDIPVLPQITYNKVADPADGVEIGDAITYTFDVTVDNGPLAEDLTLEDTLGVGLAFDTFISTAPFNCSAGTPLQCVLPAGTAQGTYSVSYTATVTDAAGDSVSNDLVASGGGSDPVCDVSCSTVVPVRYPSVHYNKSTDESGPVTSGDQFIYTVSVTIEDAALVDPLQVADQLGVGLDFVGFVGGTNPFSCSSGNSFTCTLPAGTQPGTYEFQLTVEVNDEAENFVTNTVTASGGGGESDPVCDSECSPDTPVDAQDQTYITYRKSAAPGEVQVGDTITYTVDITIAEGVTSADTSLEDTLGGGLQFDAIVSAETAAEYICQPGNPLLCSLPAGTGEGTYTLTYTATVTDDAGDTVNNAAVATGGGGGGPDCIGDCSIETPVIRPEVTYSKVADPSDMVSVGEEITYTITVTVEGARLTDDLTLEDTLGPGQDFVAFSGSTDPFTCTSGNAFTCTLPAGSEPDSYTLSYTASVNTQAQLQVENAVVATGNDNPQCDGDNCSTVVPVQLPDVTYSKSASPDQVEIGDTITYTVTVNISGGALTEDLQGTDAFGTGLVFDQLDPASDPEFQCAQGNPLGCSMPAGTAPGTYQLIYTATVTSDAGDVVSNSVTVTSGSENPPVCDGACATDTPVVRPSVTYEKAVDKSEAAIGDTLTYTVTVVVEDYTLTDTVRVTDTLGTGLTFDSFVEPVAPFVCSTGNLFNCDLPQGSEPGIYTFQYTATITDDARDSVENVVTASSPEGEPPQCSAPSCTVVTALTQPDITYEKSADKSEVEVGDTITYSVEVSVTGAALTRPLVVDDALGFGLALDGFVEPTDPFNCGEIPPRCVLPSGTPAGDYTFRYTAVVTSDAQDSVVNSAIATGGGGTAPQCRGDCDLEIPVTAPDVGFNKTADKTSVQVGDAVTYTATVSVANAATRDDVVLSDALGVGLEFDSFIEPVNPFICSQGTPLQCTLPAGSEPGTYSISYTATVTAEASQSVTNNLRARGDDNPVCDAQCELEIPLRPTVLYEKSADTSEAEVGDLVTYTLSVEVESATLTEAVILEDIPGAGLEFQQVTDSGEFSCDDGSPLHCALPAGTGPGVYSLSYTALITSGAAGEVQNTVTATAGEDVDPQCSDACTVIIPVIASQVTYSKSANRSEVAVGDTVTYTLSATVNGAPLSAPLTLTDTAGSGLSLIEVTDSGDYNCNEESPLVCTLPAGTEPGTYNLSYTARVTSDAAVEVDNQVLADGNGGSNPVCDDECAVTIPVLAPQVSVSKVANPESGTEVAVGDPIAFTIEVRVEDSALTEDLILSDTPSQGLSGGPLPDGCTRLDKEITCTLPAGTPAGIYQYNYVAEVDSSAGNLITNEVSPSGGGDLDPECSPCRTEHPVRAPEIVLTKTVARSEVQIGEIVFYTLVAENIGRRDLTDGVIVDTPAAGFTYVDDTLQVEDLDGSGTLLNTQPLVVGDIDIAAGDSATIIYGMRVGAGVRTGVHTNRAQVQDVDGTGISNEATASVVLAADPLLDESLIMGRVFHDRNGNGRQDSATLTGVRIRGGYTPEVYVPGSTTVNGVPVPDASAPLLRGIDLGVLAARGEERDAATVVVGQRLTALKFTNGFRLTSNQGYTVRLEGQDQLRVETVASAEGFRAQVTVERRVQREGDVYLVEYLIRNHGVDENGLPGVRIASVEGLLMETDQFGRYHLVGIDGGDWGRGRNFILKVDPATLPKGSRITTDNPLIRRITPGLPVRFDFGVQLPTPDTAVPLSDTGKSQTSRAERGGAL